MANSKNVKFFFTDDKSKYDALVQKDSLALYFIEDTKTGYKALYKGNNLIAVGTNVTSIEVNENGELIVNYSDGRSENIGKVGGQCAGIYIPSYSEDGILTFALSEKAGEPSYSFDIDSTNNWNPVGDEKTTYVWNKL